MHRSILPYTPSLEDRMNSAWIPVYPTFVSSENFSEMLIAHVNTVSEWAEIHHWMSPERTTASLESLFSVFLYRSGVGAESSMSICKLLLNMQKCYIRKTSVRLLWPHLLCLGLQKIVLWKARLEVTLNKFPFVLTITKNTYLYIIDVYPIFKYLLSTNQESNAKYSI